LCVEGGRDKRRENGKGNWTYKVFGHTREEDEEEKEEDKIVVRAT
jgi:hypothetical protein